MQNQVSLTNYSAGSFDRGAGVLKESIWLVVRLFLFQLCPFPLSRLKSAVLRAFGAKIGEDVVIKPEVKISFPWKLSVGDHVWLGEECCLLNLAPIVIGNHVCISQRAYLCTGSHDHRASTFDLVTRPIQLEDGAWIGASAWVGPGVIVETHAILSAGSVATKKLSAYGIYRGNPASQESVRVIS